MDYPCLLGNIITEVSKCSSYVDVLNCVLIIYLQINKDLTIFIQAPIVCRLGKEMSELHDCHGKGATEKCLAH